MVRLLFIAILAASLAFLSNCKKKEDDSATYANISTQVVANLNTISSGYTPDSLSSGSSSSAGAMSDPCEGVTDFAVCQSNLIRHYMLIGKSSVDTVALLAGHIGGALGQIPDGNSGTSTNGKISWSKTSADVWSILSRGTGNASVAYFSVNNGVYDLKIDSNNDEDNPQARQMEISVNYTDSDTWSVDIYFGNDECDNLQVTDPSKAHIKLTKANGLWTGKAMLYVPRWQAPGATAPTCLTAGGASDIAMYTEFVGNDISTKAALYLIKGSDENTAADITSANYGLPQFCSQYPDSCDGGAGELPNATALNSYTNNWCTTGSGSTPTWGNNCPTNTDVAGASYTPASEWTTPSALELKTVTMPTSL